MAGMKGFVHRCAEGKFQKSLYKKAINDSLFSKEEINIIWDFYVTHTISGGSGLGRDITDYGWIKTESRTDGYFAIEYALIALADLKDNICFIRSKSCNDTLNAMDLSNALICIEHPRAVMLRNYSITVDENEKIQFSGGTTAERRIFCLFRHIRNSLAHGNTYFFDNGMVLLEDKDGSKITAEILIKKQTLLDWIYLIDKTEKFYKKPNVEKTQN